MRGALEGGRKASVHPWGCGENGAFGGAATPGVREEDPEGWGVTMGGFRDCSGGQGGGWGLLEKKTRGGR